MTNLPPKHVLDAFGATGEPESVGRAWDNGWRYGAIVLSPVVDSAQALWSAKVRQTLEIDGAGVVKQMRTPDGRHVLAGWQARHWVEGTLQSRPDETIVIAGRIEAALEDAPRPQFLVSADDVFAKCDRAAWAADPISMLETMLDPTDIPRVDAAEALTVAGGLLKLRGEVVDAEGGEIRNRLTHADLVGTLLYDGAGNPVLTDIVPAWHPQGWTAAVAAVDALSMTGADEDLLHRFEHVAHWKPLVVRAMCYRLFVHAVHADSHAGAWRGLSRAASLVKALVE